MMRKEDVVDGEKGKRLLLRFSLKIDIKWIKVCLLGWTVSETSDVMVMKRNHFSVNGSSFQAINLIISIEQKKWCKNCNLANNENKCSQKSRREQKNGQLIGTLFCFLLSLLFLIFYLLPSIILILIMIITLLYNRLNGRICCPSVLPFSLKSVSQKSQSEKQYYLCIKMVMIKRCMWWY